MVFAPWVGDLWFLGMLLYRSGWLEEKYKC